MRRAQSGFVLAIVLGLLFVFSIIGLALMSMTNSTNKVVTGLAAATESMRSVDGALESAVAVVRITPVNPFSGTVGTSCAGKVKNPAEVDENFVVGTKRFVVTCTDSTLFTTGSASVTDYANGSRDMVLTASPDGSSDVVGRARIKVQDQTNNTSVIGYTLEVCDWQLGAAVSSTLNGCSA